MTAKLTKKTEIEILKVYESYWSHYLKGEVDQMPALLDDSYNQIGSAESEVFSTKQDAVQFLYDTIDQIQGKLEMRNRVVYLEERGQGALINETCDLYVLTDKNMGILCQI